MCVSQPFCDEEMEPNRFAGGGFRPGAWKSIDSLVRHQFVFRRNNQWQRSRNGFERGQMQCDEFSLTDKGVKFLKVMLEKFPEEDHDAGGAGGGRWSAPSSASRGGGGGGWGGASSSRGGRGGGGVRGTSPFDVRKASPEDQHKFNQDEEALDDLIHMGRVGSQKEFKKISKLRRKHLHHLCDNVKPDQFGVQLKHVSQNDGQDRRTLVITIVSQGGKRAREDQGDDFDGDDVDAFGALGGGLSPPRKRRAWEDDELEAALVASLRDSGAGAAAPSSAGRTLGSAVRDKAPAALTASELRARAAEAASARAAASTKARVVSDASVAAGGSVRAGQQDARRLDEDFGDEEDADLKAALALSLREAEQANPPAGAAPTGGGRVPSGGASLNPKPANASRSSVGPANANRGSVALREIGEGKFEIMDEDDDDQGDEDAVHEIGESQPVCVEIEESQEADTVIEIKSQEFDDSADDVEVPAASIAACPGKDVAAGGRHHRQATSSSTSSSRAPATSSSTSSRAHRQSLGQTSSLDKTTSRDMASSARMSRRTGALSAAEHARILVDTTERKRNADPREICRRLAMEVDKHSAVGCLVGGKKTLTKDDVEQKKLLLGDFTAVMVERGEEDEDAEQERVLLVVERKTVSDLCGRSLAGDHLRQISRLRGSGVTGFLLVEGNAKDAVNCTVWGLRPESDKDAGKASGSSVVQDAEQFKELLAWLVFTDKSLDGQGPGSVRVLQTKDLQQTLKLLSALSLCAACEAQGASLGRPPASLGWEDDAEAPLLSDMPKVVAQVRKAGKEMIKKLESRDVPTKAAAQMQERFGDMATAEAMVDACKSENRATVLDVADLSECREAAARRAVLQVLAPGAAAQVGSDEDDDDDVVDLTGPVRPRPGGGREVRCGEGRQSHIEASARMMQLLLPSAEDRTQLAKCSWLKIKEYSGSRAVPMVWMTLRCCSKGGVAAVHRESPPVRLSVVKGNAVIEALLKAARGAASSGSNSDFSWQFQAAAAAAAALLDKECDSHEQFKAWPRILVLEGLERACSAEQRKHGTSARELRDLGLLCDLLVSCLLLSHSSLSVWRSDNEVQ